MALTTDLLYGSLLQARTSGAHALLGVKYEDLARGFANAFLLWSQSPTNLALAGYSTGLAGTGGIVTTMSRLTIPLNVSAMLSALLGAGVGGPQASSLATVMTSGVASCLNQYGQYAGVSTGVGSGSDVSTFTVLNAASLTGILTMTWSSIFGTLGASMPMMARGLSVGVAQLLALGVGNAPVLGVTSVPPLAAVGTTMSRVV